MCTSILILRRLKIEWDRLKEPTPERPPLPATMPPSPRHPPPDAHKGRHYMSRFPPPNFLPLRFGTPPEVHEGVRGQGVGMVKCSDAPCGRQGVGRM